jgi:hypothetical protein
MRLVADRAFDVTVKDFGALFRQDDAPSADDAGY